MANDMPKTDTISTPEVVTEALVAEPEIEKTKSDNSLAMFETDADLETRGVWFQDYASGVELLVAHGDNENYTDYLQMLLRPYLSLIQSNSKEGYRFLRKMEAKAKARFVLLGWKGLFENGVEIPYSEDKAFEFLSERKWRKIKRLVDSFSGDDTAFGPATEALGKD